MTIGKIASSAEYRIDEQFQNFPIFRAKFRFSKLKKNLFSNLKIPEIFTLANSKNFELGKFQKFQ